MKIKLCGLRLPEDIKMALELKPWAVGFIFYEKSPRSVPPPQIGELLRKFDPSLSSSERPPSARTMALAPLKVGVFVNARLDEIAEGMKASSINAVQLHGEETSDFCAEVKRRFPLVKLIKALRPAANDDLKIVRPYAKKSVCDFILIDAFSPEARGGTGLTSRWDLARDYVQKISDPPLILSGGLGEKNLAEAVSSVNPYAVDISSSLEISPGVKDHRRVRSLYEKFA